MKRFLSLAAACLLAAACDGDATGPGGGAEAPRRYTVVPIEVPAGTVPPASIFMPAAMNGSGQVVLGANFTGRTFALWSGGSVTVLTAPYQAFATGLNDAGQVVGCTGTPFGEGEQRPLLGGEDGRLWYLAGAGLERACAQDVNDQGVVVGEAREGQRQRSRAFVVSGGRVTFVTVPGDTAAMAVAVNERGHVAINSSRIHRFAQYFSSLGQVSLWRGGEVVPLGRLDWSPAGPGQVADPEEFSYVAADLNDRDEVVGTVNASVCTADRYACFTRYRAFLWRGGRMIDLGRDRPEDNSSAVAVNRSGHVLMTVYEGNTAVPSLWSDGRLLDLNEAISGTGWRLTYVGDLNDAGQVLGIALNEATGRTAPVRLDPA